MRLPKFLSNHFRFSRGAVIASLGALEQETMNIVWREKEVSVRQATDALDQQLAYTTVMTTLDRLHKKGFLDRRKKGRAFLYSPCYTADELELGMTENLIGSLLDSATEQVEPVLACIVDAVSERDLQMLDELERLVQEKKREIGNME